MKRLYLLVAILTLLATIVGGIAIKVLYDTAYEVKRQDLIQMVKSQARLIEVVARFDKKSDLTDQHESTAGATISQLREAISTYKGFGETGEFVVGARDGEQIIFLFRHHHLPDNEPVPIPFASDLAEPMRRALLHQSGTVLGLDYRGETVLAAHEPIAELGLGIVAKVDLSEIRSPFITAVAIIAGVGGLAIVIGAFLFFSISNPVFKALEASEKRHRLTLQTILDGIISIDAAGIIKSANPAAERIFGYAFPEIAGKNVSMLMPEPFASEHDSYLEAYRKTGNARIIGIGRDVEGLRKDGTVFPMNLSISEMNVDGETLFIGAVRDITQQLKTERAVREQSNLVRLLLTIASQANEAVSIDDALFACLTAVCEFKGWPVGHVYVLSPEDENLLISSDIWHLENPEKAAAFKKLTNETEFRAGIGLPGRVMESRRPLWISDLHQDGRFLRTKMATDIDVKSGFAIPVFVGGRVAAVMEFFSFQIEESAGDFLDTLSHIAGEMSQVFNRVEREQALRESIAETEKANRAKSEFLSSMSHELRTPLNAVLGFAQLLELNPKSPLTMGQKDSVAHIKTGGEHLLELVTQVLDLSKIESGNLVLANESVDLAGTIGDCLSITQRLAGPAGISFVDNIAGKSLPRIYTDPTRVKQVILNLLSNAVKYNRAGGAVTVDASEMPDAMIRISVKDTGPGIAAPAQDKVFEAFNRLGREALDIEGTGIGLTISKQLVELMMGRIGFESEVGKGSTFWFDLPTANKDIHELLGEPGIDAAHALESIPDILTRHNTVLYVEDNPANIVLMESVFDDVPNVTLKVATSAETCLEIARAEKPDLILMDIQLPGMDGIEATKLLRANAETGSIPVIAISAAAMKNDVERAEDARFHAYLTKPINITETLRVVREALQGGEQDA